MSKAVVAVSSLFILASATLIPIRTIAQGNSAQVAAPKLREIIVNMGYEVKDLSIEAGKEKYEFKVTKNGLDVFLAAEITPSKNYVWLTAFLGKTSEIEGFSGRAENILKENGKIQPSQFYVTSSGSLMIGIPIDNRNIDAVVLKRCMDKVSGDVANTVRLWQKSSGTAAP